MTIIFHLRVKRGIENLGATTGATPGIQDRGKVSEHRAISRQVSLSRRCGAPAECFSDAAWKLAYERARIAQGIEIIEHLGPVMFNLGEQNLFKRRFFCDPFFACPLTLQDHVITICEKCIPIVFENGFQKVECAEAIVEKYPQPLFKAKCARGQLI
ncbi:hypothetical protein [Nitrobacter vulgaris]|uniref:hypothetical protein n=1 Tax=Nitrobacter vulgaris TaxID=29421 RepID=UPI00286B7B07|nr:hypothetical protein [Nitrobacter vulgaris]